MPFKIIRNDITKGKADAIVNTANPHPACLCRARPKPTGKECAVYK